MKNAMLKNAFSEIKKTKSRFFSIFGIIAIGTGFFAGLLSSAPDMRLSSDSYYDKSNLMNYRVVSTYGFDENDIKALDDIDGLNVYPGYFTDAFIHTDGVDKVARVYSLDKLGENNECNNLQIIEGRLPENENECVIDGGKMVSGYGIGDKITLTGDSDTDINDTLSVTEYTIVGKFNTSMFISDTQRGNTTIGTGSVSMLAYVPAENFKTEYYTQVFITADELSYYNCYADDFIDKSDEIKELLESVADTRETERFDDILSEANDKIADAEKELADKKQEAYDKIADGEKELEDAKAQLDDAKVQLADGKKELDDAKAQLDDSEIQLADSKKLLDDTAVQLADSKKQLDDNKKLLEDTKLQLDNSKKKLDDSEKTLASAKAELDENKQLLDSTKAQLDSAKAELDKNQSELDAARTQLAQGIAAGLIDEQTAAATKAQLDASQSQIDNARVQYEQGLAQYNAGCKQYSEGLEKYNSGYAEYSRGLEQYSAGYAKYEDGVKQLETGYAQYNDGYAQYEDGLKKYEDGLQKYEDGLKQYNDGVAEYEKNYADYEKGLAEYNDGVKELRDSKAEAEEKLADGQKEIDDAKAEINDLEKPVWYVFDRDDNPGYTEYGQNAERMKNIALVFPVFFVMVAALVCLTTMTRMVEEQRTQIGTLKALGYGSGSIILKYMIYALTAAILGALFGTLVGLKIFPTIIIMAYSMMYKIPDCILPYDPVLICATIAASVVLVSLTVYFSCKAILHEQPAELMRPKAPKSGKKILLEHVGFIWKHLTFSHKVTLRNIFRYKRRMLMTVIGIAGCTALVLTGFGVYDSVNDILYKQFDEISNYTGIAAYSDSIEEKELADAFDILDSYGYEAEYIYQKQITAEAGSNSTEAYIFAGNEDSDIAKFVTVKDRLNGEHYTVGDDGVIINEKLATLLGNVKRGDTITLVLSDTEKVQAKVSEICENYAHHYIYINENYYKQITGDSIPYNSIFFNSPDGDEVEEALRDEISEKLMGVDGIMGVSFKTSVEGTFANMLKSLTMVVIVLIVSAGVLAFIVLYNLTNININERIREIATLKVLGFYDKEVSMYVFRETIILTLLGTVTGLLFGRFLVDFVVRTAEIDMVMFGRDVHPTSYIISVVITLVFALIVTLVMHRHLKKVDMVEALKSVE